MTDPIIAERHGRVAETVGGYGTQVFAVAAAELRKLAHDPWEVFGRALLPVFWLLFFGEVMSRARSIAPAGERYLDFLAPGILALSVLVESTLFGIAAVWEQDLGVLHRYLVSPAPRTALIIGKVLSSGVRALLLTGVVYSCAVVLGVQLSVSPIHVAIVILLVVLGSALFTTFSLIIASLGKTRERFMAAGQLLVLPIVLASSVFYPTTLMPPWLNAIARTDPLIYELDGLRATMLARGASAFGLGHDFLILLSALAICVVIASYLYPRLTQ